MAQKSLIRRIISSPLVQTFFIYVSGGWAALELTDYIIKNYGLNDRARDVMDIILLIGLPVAVFLSWYLSRERAKEFKNEQEGDVGGSKVGTKKIHLYTSVGVALLLIFGIIYFIWIKSDLPAYDRANLELRSEKAGDKAKKARTLKNARAHALYIYASYEGNDYVVPPEIVKEYQKLLDDHPESPEAHFYLGEVYFFSWDTYVFRDPVLLDSAWILINKALDMGMKSFDADNMKMFLMRTLGLVQHVKESAEMLVLDYPEESSGWSNAGNIFLRQLLDTTQAIEYYQKALEVYPRNIEAYTGLADIYIVQRKYELAMEMLNATLKINPNYWKIADSYLNLYKKSGRFNEAASFFEGIIEKYNIKFLDYNRILANIYIQSNDTVKARAFIEASLDQYPGDYNLLSSKNELRRIIRLEEEESKLNANQKILWLEDFEEALAVAKKENKPIFVEFYNNWNNYWLQRMNRDIFSDSSIQLMLEEYVPVRLSESSNPEIFKEYGIDRAYYHLKIISTDRVLLENMDNYIKYPGIFLAALSKGLEKYSRYQLGRKLNSESFTEVSNFADARIISEARGFPIMVVISNESSPYSRRLLNETLKDPVFKSEFNNVVYFKISPERYQDLIETWNVKIFPSILFFDSNGDIIHRAYGYKTPESLAAMVRNVKETYARSDNFEPEINWLFNLEEAKMAALVEEKKIFMSSKYFRNNTILTNDTEVIKMLEDFICLSVEDVLDTEMISQYGYLYRYTCLILDPSGKEIFKNVSLNKKEELLKWLDIEQEMKKMSFIGPEQYKNYRNQIDIAEAMGFYMPRSSINIYKAQLEIFPNDLDIMQKLGNLHLSLKDAEEAIKYFQMEVENNIEYSDDLLQNIIESYLQLGKHQELKAWFDGQITANEMNDSKQARLYRYYSELSEILMDSVMAREYAFKAIQINPVDFKSYTHLGRLLYYSGEHDEARKYLVMATKKEEEAAKAHLYLALIADDLGEIDVKEKNIDIALEKSQIAIRLFDNNYQSRSKFYLYSGYISLIKRNYSDLLRIAPFETMYKRRYAEYLANFGSDFELALQLIDESIHAEPEAWLYHDIKAWIHYRMGQVAEADRCISLYLQNEGDRYIESSLSALYHIGKIKLTVGDSIMGYEYLRKTQELRHIDPMDELIEEDVTSILKEAI